MVALNVIRRIETRATSSGIDEVNAKLGALARAQTTVASTADGMAVSTESSARRQLSAAGAYDRLMRTVDDAFRSQQRFSAGQAVVERAFQQGIIDARQYTIDLQKVADKFGVVSLGAQRQAAEMERAAAAQARINAVTGVSGGSDMTSRGADVAAYGKQLDDLRAKYSPLYAAQRQYKETLSDIGQAARVGAITERERAEAVMNTKVAFVQQVNSLRGVHDAQSIAAGSAAKLGSAVGLNANEWKNLGFQVNDAVTMMASGSGVFQVVATQGGQVYQVLSGANGGVSGALKSITGYLGSVLTVGRLAFGGVAAAIGVAGLALNGFLDNQTKVQRSLLGSGRASGASLGDVNSAAENAASLTGLSVSQARELASALAATGKIGKENLAPIAAIGHDLATALGTDAKGAAEALASAFADPVKGAQDLNERLGFLDAATERNIANLVAQNRMYDAQKVLLTGVKAGLVGYSETVSEHTKLWTVLGNVISNAWDAAGKYAARGLGLSATLEERIAAAKKNLDELKAGTSNAANAEFAATGLGTGYEPLQPQFDPAKIAEAQKEYDRLIATQDKLSQSANIAAAAQASLAQQTIIRGLSPEIAQREALNNQLVSMERLLDSISNDEAGGARLKQLNLTFAELVRLLEKARAESAGFRSEFQKMQDANKIAMDATTAFSPGARAEIARREARDRYAQDPNVDKIGQDAYNLSLKQSTVALTEMQRARQLSADQAAESAKLELSLVGRSIGEQTELRANLQAEQTIRQQLSQQHMEWGAAQDAEMVKLRASNKLLGERQQLIALKGAQQQADFHGQTMFMSQSDQAAAQVMQNIYGPQWQSHMDDALAKQIKMNVLTQQVGDAAATLGNNLIQAFASGKSGLDALLPALSSFGSSLTSIGTDSLKSGISGMLKGLGTSGFDPVSLGIGAAGMGISLISNLIGGDAKKRAELEAAQAEWKKAGPAFQTFLAQLSGGAQGSLSQMFTQLWSTTQDFATKAAKANDYASLTRVYSAFGENVYRTTAVFRESFGGMLDAINEGLGPNSPFATGASNIKQIGETLKGFIDDAKLAYSATPDQVAIGLTNAKGSESQVAAATRAAQSYMLSLLGQAPVLSETATAIQTMNGTAVQLRSVLVDLGMSSEAAADSIRSGVVAAMEELRTKFADGLTERLNTAQGNGYLNDAKTLLKQYQQDTADAAALGLDQAQVAAVFRAEAQKIVDDAGLVGDSFSSFIDLFPQFNGLVGQSATALAAATQKVQAFVKSLNDYLNNLAVGSNSTLSPAAQLAAAQTNFSAQMALARAGNDDALGTITQYATTLLDQAKSFYASSGGYTAIYDQVTSALKDLPGALGAGDGTSKIVGAINTAASQSAQAEMQTQALLNTQTLLMSTSNSLANSQISLANSQVGILSSIQGLQSTSSAQLDLLNKQYAAAPVTALNGSGGTLQVDNLMIHALNKIVYNTYAIAQNTAGGSVKFGGVYAEGGWITGGVTGRDSVPLANGGLGMPGEFVVRHDIAQANKAWLPDFNSTGRLPMPPMVSRRVSNDNAPAPANDEAKYWRGLAETLIRDGEATRAEIRGLKAEVAASSRDQVDAFKRAPRQMPGTRTGRSG